MAIFKACSALLLVLLQPSCITAIKSKPITVSLQAKWPATPLVSEASEFLAEKGENSFWSFVDSLSELKAADVGGKKNMNFDIKVIL